MDLTRLPAIDAALVLELTGLECLREQFGWQTCLLRGVGPRRKKLGPIADQPGITISPVEMARDGARQALAGLCATCEYKQCRMKKWGMG